MLFCQPSMMQKSNNHTSILIPYMWIANYSNYRTCHACLCLNLAFLSVSVKPSHPRAIFFWNTETSKAFSLCVQFTTPASPRLCWKFVAHPCVQSAVKVSYLESEAWTLSTANSAQITNKNRLIHVISVYPIPSCFAI